MDVRVPQRYERVSKPQSGVWIRLLGAQLPVAPYPDHTTLTDSEADAIMQWSMQNKVGVRMAYDMWRFKNEKELLVFLLKWC